MVLLWGPHGVGLWDLDMDGKRLVRSGLYRRLLLRKQETWQRLETTFHGTYLALNVDCLFLAERSGKQTKNMCDTVIFHLTDKNINKKPEESYSDHVNIRKLEYFYIKLK